MPKPNLEVTISDELDLIDDLNAAVHNTSGLLDLLGVFFSVEGGGSCLSRRGEDLFSLVSTIQVQLKDSHIAYLNREER